MHLNSPQPGNACGDMPSLFITVALVRQTLLPRFGIWYASP